MLNIPWISEQDILEFPAVETASKDPDGLLLLGGNLSDVSLENAYNRGIFPWFDGEQPIMWWSPSVRAILPTDSIHISKGMAKLIRTKNWNIKMDYDFSAIINACSKREETWITAEMQNAYTILHNKGIAHSVEVYDDDELIGGLYGVFIKNCFCGESMISHKANASKVALIMLAKFLSNKGCHMIDCQLPTQHLKSMGAISVKRNDFITRLYLMENNPILNNKKWSALCL